MKDLTVDINQIRLASSYVQDKSQREEEEEFQLEMLRVVDRLPHPGLLRVRLFSRFRNAAKYQLWISYRLIHDNEMDDGMQNNELIPIIIVRVRLVLGLSVHVRTLPVFYGFWGTHDTKQIFATFRSDYWNP